MALWRSRVRTPSGPPSYRQSEWYRGTPFVSERKGFFCFVSPNAHLGGVRILRCARLNLDVHLRMRTPQIEKQFLSFLRRSDYE